MESRVRSRQDKRGRGVISVSCKAGVKLQPIIAGGREDVRGYGGRGEWRAGLGQIPHTEQRCCSLLFSPSIPGKMACSAALNVPGLGWRLPSQLAFFQNFVALVTLLGQGNLGISWVSSGSFPISTVETIAYSCVRGVLGLLFLPRCPSVGLLVISY